MPWPPEWRPSSTTRSWLPGQRRCNRQGTLDRGAEGIVLGCTELELLVTPGSLGTVPLFPTTQLHVEAALRVALAP
jgi:aspartate/glutamate racemase